MKYAITQKIIAFGDDFNIKDEHGRDIYFVDGKAFTFGHDLSFQDMQGNELARIKQKLFTFRSTHHIIQKGIVVGVVSKALLTFRPRFEIEYRGGQNFQAVGNLFRYNYKFIRTNWPIGTVSKKILSIRDCYGVDLDDGQDEVFMLCCAVIIDMVLHNKKSDHHRSM